MNILILSVFGFQWEFISNTNVLWSGKYLLNEKEGLECESCVDGMRLEHVSEFKYLRCVLGESGTYEAEGGRKVARGLQVL